MRLRSFCGAATKLYSAAVAGPLMRAAEGLRSREHANEAARAVRRSIGNSWAIRWPDLTANPGGNSAFRVAHPQRRGLFATKRMPPMQPLTLVFDLDGTLVDTARDLMGTLNVILAREGAAPLPVEQASSLLGAGARALLERGFAVEGRAVEKEHMDVLYRDFLDHYAEHLADESRAFEGVERALTRFRDRGDRLAVCTNKVTWHSKKL